MLLARVHAPGAHRPLAIAIVHSPGSTAARVGMHVDADRSGVNFRAFVCHDRPVN